MPLAPTSIAAVSGIETTTDAFRVAFVEMCQRIGLNPDWLAAVVSFESGFNPAARNGTSGASGLIQFMPGKTGSATLLGYTTEEIRGMTAEEQVPLIERYMVELVKPANLARVKTITDTYLTVFGPTGIGKGENSPLYSAPSNKYYDNQKLDKDGDGVITTGEAAGRVKQILYEAESKPRIAVPGGGELPPLAKPGAAPPLTALIAFALGLGLDYASLRMLSKRWPVLAPRF